MITEEDYLQFMHILHRFPVDNGLNKIEKLIYIIRKLSWLCDEKDISIDGIKNMLDDMGHNVSKDIIKKRWARETGNKLKNYLCKKYSYTKEEIIELIKYMKMRRMGDYHEEYKIDLPFEYDLSVLDDDDEDNFHDIDKPTKH